MMNGSSLLVIDMIVMMVVMCGGMVVGAGLAMRRRIHRAGPSAPRRVGR